MKRILSVALITLACSAAAFDASAGPAPSSKCPTKMVYIYIGKEIISTPTSSGPLKQLCAYANGDFTQTGGYVTYGAAPLCFVYNEQNPNMTPDPAKTLKGNIQIRKNEYCPNTPLSIYVGNTPLPQPLPAPLPAPLPKGISGI